MPRLLPAALATVILATACATPPPPREGGTAADGAAQGRPAAAQSQPGDSRTEGRLVQRADEPRLRDVRMLTNGGENAEAYWSWDGTRLVFQARRGDEGCDRIRIMNADGTNDRLVAERGAHTCAFFLRGDERVVYASTMSGGDECPPPPDRSRGYVWALHPSYEIYSARLDGSDVKRLTDSPGYDAEATVGPSGRVLFTSVRDGDIDVYSMAPDGSDVKRLTHAPGYDGGAFYSPDGTKIVFRASRPTGDDLEEYRALLSEGLVRPSRLELFVMDADGSNQRQVTSLGGAAFAPYFTPDSRAILFSSNHLDPRGRNFDLFLVRLDGSGLERVTTNETFDSFPMFSPDGSKLAFCSNRGNRKPGETNVFVADWVSDPAAAAVD